MQEISYYMLLGADVQLHFFYKIFTHGHLLGQRNDTKYHFPAVCQCKASSVFLFEHQPRYQWI